LYQAARAADRTGHFGRRVEELCCIHLNLVMPHFGNSVRGRNTELDVLLIDNGILIRVDRTRFIFIDVDVLRYAVVRLVQFIDIVICIQRHGDLVQPFVSCRNDGYIN